VSQQERHPRQGDVIQLDGRQSLPARQWVHSRVRHALLRRVTSVTTFLRRSAAAVAAMAKQSTVQMRNVVIGDDRSKARLRKTDSVAEQMRAANRN